MFAQPRRRLLFSLAFVAAFAAACAAPPRQRGIDNEGLVVGRLKTVNPLEVVVPPIENHTGKAGLPLGALRTEFQEGLVALRYSPLALDFVDRTARASEASYRPGTLGEQATLRVVLTGWDTSRWASHASLVVDADVYMLDAAEPDTAKALWGGHATRSIDLSAQRTTFISEAAMLQRAVELAVDGILASLPARDPERTATR